MVPPLWGPDSFNNGAGTARLITAANFVHFNMPPGTDDLDAQLTVEQAWDVAAYVISQPRPTKPGLDKDFPDLVTKPVDAPYGPYADGFDQQHVRTIRSDPGGARQEESAPLNAQSSSITVLINYAAGQISVEQSAASVSA